MSNVWRCPKCRGKLQEVIGGENCVVCATHYPSIEGILDLRLPGVSWIDYEVDREAARRLVAETKNCSVEETVRYVYLSQPGRVEAGADVRTRQVMEAVHRRRSDLENWTKHWRSQDGYFLDLGCGPGMLLAAAAKKGMRGIGVDVSLTWLLVAQRLIRAEGGDAHLAAALAETLPLPDESVSGLASLDVIEHVADPAPYLREINRVVQPGGCMILTTPNRFILSAEPHVGVWGVGWMPRVWQKSYVRWRSGKNYDFVRLISAAEAQSLCRQHTAFEQQVDVPLLPEEEIRSFPPRKPALGRLYNRLTRLAGARPLFLRIGPMFQLIRKKPAKTSFSAFPYLYAFC